MLYLHRIAEPNSFYGCPAPWVARIIGPDPKFKWARKFVRAHRDWSGAGRSMRGNISGVVSQFALEIGRVYEVSAYTRKRHLRYFAEVTESGLVEIDESEVEKRLKAPAGKRPIGIDVLTAARERVSWVFDRFPRIYLSGPSGKDSGAMMHVVCAEARRRKRKIGVLYVDLEAQYKVTIDHVREMFALYADVIDPHWVALPLRLRNAVSMAEPYWICWDPEKRDSWVRQPSPESTTDSERYPFHRMPSTADDGMRIAQEFEEFVEHFGHWYSEGKHATACFVGIRSDESLNRWRAITKARKSRLEDKCWTSWKGGNVFNIYPIYDWRTADVWTYFGREKLPYNKLYDHMYKAGLSIHQMRICQPFGDDQRRGLSLYHVIEPESWARVVARVAGANQGALYAGKAGNILGNGKVTLPPGHTWQSYARFLLDSLPAFERGHFEVKIGVFLKWWAEHGVGDVPDESDPKLEAQRKTPSWRRICKVILKNDRMCRGLGFSQHVSSTYERYRDAMKKRGHAWTAPSKI